jgi:hypothetical protein
MHSKDAYAPSALLLVNSAFTNMVLDVWRPRARGTFLELMKEYNIRRKIVKHTNSPFGTLGTIIAIIAGAFNTGKMYAVRKQ